MQRMRYYVVHDRRAPSIPPPLLKEKEPVPLLVTALFVFFPLAEIATFVVVGGKIGALATVAFTIATSVVGAALMRWQGFGILRRLQRELDRGGSPGRELAHGAMVLLAGVLLLIPGFLTDALGLLLFIPPVRDLAWRFLRSRATVVTDFSFSAHRGTGAGGGRTIDLDEDEFARTSPSRQQGHSPWRRPELE